ncbi:MAG: FAD-binding oxidoreductase [Gemmataceae bacterium]|nr:FAD-binding oxidoreductase [Gemmataceae bacterium]
MSVPTCQVAVLGAGIVGAACARALAQADFQVVIIDPNPIGSGATAAGMGHILLIDDSPAQFALTQNSRQQWNDLAPELPDDCEFVKCGTLWLAADEDELDEVRRKEERFRAAGVAAEVLDTRQLAAAEPNLRAGLLGAFFIPDDRVIYPPCAARWMIEEAQRHGTQLRTGVSAIEVTGKEVRLSDGSRISVEFTVHATGCGTAKMLPGVPIRPRKGHLIITDRYPGFVRHALLELGYIKKAHGTDTDSVSCVVHPRRTGQVLVGSSRQFDAESKDVDPRMLARVVARATEFLPGLTRLSGIRAWTGFRAATPDGLPLIGPYPELPGLYLATGHEGHGITTSLGTAELIVDHLTGRTPRLPLEPYLPARFSGVPAHA